MKVKEAEYPRFAGLHASIFKGEGPLRGFSGDEVRAVWRVLYGLFSPGHFPLFGIFKGRKPVAFALCYDNSFPGAGLLIRLLSSLIGRIGPVRTAELELRAANFARKMGSEKGALFLLYIGVSEESRGKGLGKELLGEAFRYAGGRFSCVELAVEKGNPAIHLYKRAGFGKVGEFEEGGAWIAMRRKL